MGKHTGSQWKLHFSLWVIVKMIWKRLLQKVIIFLYPFLWSEEISIYPHPWPSSKQYNSTNTLLGTYHVPGLRELQSWVKHCAYPMHDIMELVHIQCSTLTICRVLGIQPWTGEPWARGLGSPESSGERGNWADKLAQVGSTGLGKMEALVKAGGEE